MSAMNTNMKRFGLILNRDTSTVTNTSTFTINTNTIMALENHEIALKAASIENEIPNISEALGNHQFKYTNWQGTERTVNILPAGNTAGIFSIDDLNGVLKTAMYNYGDFLLDPDGIEFYFLELTANTTVNKFQVNSIIVPTTLTSGTYNGYTQPYTSPATGPDGVTVAPAAIGTSSVNFRFRMMSNYLQTTLGFPAGDYPPTAAIGQSTRSVLSTNTPYIANVTSLTIKCNLCGNSDFTNIHNLLAAIPINAAPTYMIEYAPNSYIFRYIPPGYYTKIELQISDQTGQPVTFIGNPDCNFEIWIKHTSATL